MKKVVLAVDFSPVSQKITETGYAIAKSMNAQVALVHVVADISYYSIEYSPLMGYSGFDGENIRQLSVDMKKEANDFVKAAAAHLGDSQIETYVLEGDPADAILQFAHDWKADLIAMGAHSRGALDILVGNVTAHILKKAKVPVLVVPED